MPLLPSVLQCHLEESCGDSSGASAGHRAFVSRADAIVAGIPGPLGRSRENSSGYGRCLDWGAGRAGGQVGACVAEVLSCIASPLLAALQLVGLRKVDLACWQHSSPSALYSLCISFQLCVEAIHCICPGLAPFGVDIICF